MLALTTLLQFVRGTRLLVRIDQAITVRIDAVADLQRFTPSMSSCGSLFATFRHSAGLCTPSCDARLFGDVVDDRIDARDHRAGAELFLEVDRVRADRRGGARRP